MKPTNETIRFIIFLFLLYTKKVEAQLPPSYFEYGYNSTGLYSSFEYNSNAINKKLFMKLYRGGVIEEELKNVNLYGIQPKNRMGYDFSSLAYVKYRVDSFLGHKNILLYTGLHNQNHTDILFTDDLMKLILQGNSHFKGQPARISPFSYTQLLYHEWFAGLQQQIIRNQRLVNQSLSFSFILASQYQSLWSQRASLYTAPDGDSIYLDLSYIYSRSDTNRLHYLDINGWGIAASFFTEVPVGDCDLLRVSMDGFGYVIWNKQSITQWMDSSYAFTGFHLGNFMAISDSVQNQQVSLQPSTTQEKFGTLLPSFFLLEYEKYAARNFYFNTGIRLRLMANYKPFIYVRPSYFIHPSCCLHFLMAYGGYGNIVLGISIEKIFAYRWVITAGSNNLDGLLSRNGYGLSAFVGIKYMWKEER